VGAIATVAWNFCLSLSKRAASRRNCRSPSDGMAWVQSAVYPPGKMGWHRRAEYVGQQVDVDRQASSTPPQRGFLNSFSAAAACWLARTTADRACIAPARWSKRPVTYLLMQSDCTRVGCLKRLMKLTTSGLGIGCGTSQLLFGDVDLSGQTPMVGNISCF
jgi:hypothetical protein